MKFKTSIQIFMTLSLGLSSASYANRLKDDAYRKHCSGMTREDCRNQLADSLSVSCATQEEYNYGMDESGGYYRVPICSLRGKFTGWCFCSCFAKGTLIWVEDVENHSREWIPVEDLVANRHKYLLVIPSKNASMQSMEYTTSAIEYWSAGEEANPLYALKFSNNTELVLTGAHSVMLSNGTLVEASNVVSGDRLIQDNGMETEVLGIELRQTDDEVFNVWLESSDNPYAHFLFANHRLVGDAFLENLHQEEVARFRFPK